MFRLGSFKLGVAQNGAGGANYAGSILGTGFLSHSQLEQPQEELFHVGCHLKASPEGSLVAHTQPRGRVE